jgi:VanZ family protein
MVVIQLNINKIKITIWLLIAFLFLSTIFIQSTMPYKQQDIKPVLREMIEIEKIPISFPYGHRVISGNRPYEFLEFIIRKTGHIIQYFMLTLILLKTLSILKVRHFLVLLLSFLLSFIIALFDEWHQRFSAGRSGQLIDVFTFDLFGIMIAVVGFLLFKKQKVKAFSKPSGKTKRM